MGNEEITKQNRNQVRYDMAKLFSKNGADEQEAIYGWTDVLIVLEGWRGSDYFSEQEIDGMEADVVEAIEEEKKHQGFVDKWHQILTGIEKED